MSDTQIKAGAMSTFDRVISYYRGNWIIDVGCNIGMFIECVLERFPGASVLGFEPVKRHYDEARKLFANKGNVYLENYAVGDSDSEETIFVAKNNIGWNTMVGEMVDDDNRTSIQKVHTICFDKYWDYTGLDVKVDIVKIDVEGYEYKVLNGMRRFLKDQRPTIICEIGWGKNHPHWDEELKAFEYLYSIGYSRENEEEILNLSCTKDFLFRSI